MANAAAQLDALTQGLIDKVMSRVDERLEAEKSEIKAQNESQLVVVRGQQAEEILKGWSPVPDGHPYRAPRDKADMGIRGARVVRAFAACQGQMQRVPAFLSDRLHDKDTTKIVERSMSTGSLAGGGALLMDEFLVGEFYPLLRDMVSIWDLGARRVPMPKGTLTIAGFDSGASVGWIGEGKSRAATRPSFGRIKLSSKKAFGIVSISNDLLEESDYQVDMLVRDDLLGAFTELITNTCLHNQGTENSPMGVAKEDGRTQLSIGALLTADHPPLFIKKLRQAKVQFTFEDAGWVFNSEVWSQLYNLKTNTGDYHYRDEMNTGRLLGFRYKVTEAVETGSSGHYLTHIFFGKWSELIVGVTREFQAEMFREASLRADENGDDINAAEDDVTLLRCILKLDSRLRIKKAIVHSNDVWTVA